MTFIAKTALSPILGTILPFPRYSRKSNDLTYLHPLSNIHVRRVTHKPCTLHVMDQRPS